MRADRMYARDPRPSVVLRVAGDSEHRGRLPRVVSASAGEQRPLLVAIAERLAAERYRGWAKET
jgi:hypothetical protein